MRSRLGRRELLSGVGLAAAGVFLGCLNTTVSRPTATTAAVPTAATFAPTPTPVPPSATPAPPDWAALRGSLRGELLRPSDAAYDPARLLYNTRFDGVRPEGIARCTTTADVSECLLFARRHALPLAVRSGGHSYAGASTGPGLVIDLRRMNAIAIDERLVRIGAGAQLIDVYAAIAARGLGIAAGSCPTVGISGLTLAGGLGVLTRAWGLTCDSVLEAEVVTADGVARICDSSREPDLFWALRGGGGGNFGVVTSLTLEARPVTRLSLSFLRWEGARARDVLHSWQAWIGASSEDLWSNLHLSTRPGGVLDVAVHVVSLNEASDLGVLVDRLTRSVGGAPTYREVGSLPYMDAMLLEAGCLGRTVGQCHLKGETDQGTLERETYLGTSVVAETAMSGPAILAIIDGLERLRDGPNAGAGAVIIDALGGAVAGIAPDATAFPHRRALATIQILSSWSPTTSADVVSASGEWLTRYRDDLRAAIGRGAYVGYMDAELPGWEAAYYGANYARLQRVKAKVDPTSLFTFARSVRAP